MGRGAGGLAAAAIGAAVLALAGGPGGAAAADQHVVVATLDGVIDPITDNYVVKAVDQAAAGHATALVISLDTPGGLDTSMRDIIQRMLGAPVPVVIFVSPSGARAASAGLYITEASDVAAMAPGTNIGSAHPVTIGGNNPVPNPSASPSSATDIESIKVENDAAAYVRALASLHHRNAAWAEKAVRQSVNVPADEAVQLQVVDLESRDLVTPLAIGTGFLAEGVNVGLLLATLLLIGGTFAFILRKVIDARRRPYAAGEESLVGRTARVRERLAPSGMVFIDGALWRATSQSGELDVGAPVRVVAVRGLELMVEALPAQSPSERPQREPLPGRGRPA